MKKAIYNITTVFPGATLFHLAMLVFRLAVSLELIIVHGFKKLGIGVAVPEDIPNPIGLPEQVNNLFAISANLIFPVFIIVGFFTRLAAIPVLAVTLTGYFVLHWNDSLPDKDVPFMYSISFMLIMALGAGRYSADYLVNKKASR